MRRLGLWAVVICMLLAVAPIASAAPEVEMAVRVSNEGRVKYGGWVTVIVDLVSHGGETTLDVVVEPAGDFPHAQYVVPVTLPAGGRKRIPVAVSSMVGQQLQVTLRSGEDLIESRKIDPIWLPPQVPLIGILSGDELGIPALNQVQLWQTEAQVVRLEAETFPDQTGLLADFDAIALSRFDTATLSGDQQRALEVWVNHGGTLLLTGGPEWKRTFTSLPAGLVPVEITGVRQVVLDPLGELAGKPFSGAGPVSEARALRGQTLVSSAGMPLVVSSQVGSGRVVYLAFDPGLTPVAEWPGQSQLYSRVLAGGGQRSGAWQENRSWMMREALQRIPDWGLPAIWTVLLLLGSYMLLIGPVNYLVLKRLDRREWSWVSIPALSVLFVGIVYGLGFGRHEALVSHLITVTQLSPEANAGTMTAYVGLYSPGRERMAVPLEGARLVKPLENGPGVNSSVYARVVAGEKTTLELLALNNYSMGGFSMEQDIALPAGLELVEGRFESGQIVGRIRNRLAVSVDHLLVASGSSFDQLGRLEPGALSEPFSLLPGSGPGRFDPRMGPVGVPLPGMSDEGADAPRRDMVRDYVLGSTAERSSGGLLVMGWTEQPLVPPALPDLGRLVQGANLIYSILPPPIAKSSAELPRGLVLGWPLDPKQANPTPSGFLLQPGTQIFTLQLPPLQWSAVSEVILYTGIPGQVPVAAVEVKNQQTGEWLPLQVEENPLPAWQEYLSPAGLIEMRYTVKEPIEMQQPTVAVRGGSR